jgi:hypothetical protein
LSAVPNFSGQGILINVTALSAWQTAYDSKLQKVLAGELIYLGDAESLSLKVIDLARDLLEQKSVEVMTDLTTLLYVLNTGLTLFSEPLLNQDLVGSLDPNAGFGCVP